VRRPFEATLSSTPFSDKRPLHSLSKKSTFGEITPCVSSDFVPDFARLNRARVLPCLDQPFSNMTFRVQRSTVDDASY